MSWQEALDRVEFLKKYGIWTGIRCHRDGTFSPVYDPGIIVNRRF
jgi:hypothetical protein